jgi:hypothetical protein
MILDSTYLFDLMADDPDAFASAWESWHEDVTTGPTGDEAVDDLRDDGTVRVHNPGAPTNDQTIEYLE